MREIDARLRECLVGTFVSHVEYDDQWRLKTTDGMWLCAQRLATSFDSEVEAALRDRADSLLLSIDVGVVPTAAGVFRLLRHEILDARAESSGELVISFLGAQIRARADVKIVDWQWNVCGDRNIPYIDYDVACFGPRDVRVKKS